MENLPTDVRVCRFNTYFKTILLFTEAMRVVTRLVLVSETNLYGTWGKDARDCPLWRYSTVEMFQSKLSIFQFIYIAFQDCRGRLRTVPPLWRSPSCELKKKTKEIDVSALRKSLVMKCTRSGYFSGTFHPKFRVVNFFLLTFTASVDCLLSRLQGI